MRCSLCVLTVAALLCQTAFPQSPASTKNDSFSLAETYLSKIAAKKEKQRKLGGTFGIVGGVVSLGIGFALLAEDDKDDFFQLNDALGTLLIAQGAILTGVGAWRLATRTKAEKNWAAVMALSDPDEKQKSARQFLHSLARSARKERMIDSAIFTGIAILHFSQVRNEDRWLSALLSVTAVYGFARQSMEERELKKFLHEDATGSSTRFGFGFLPGGVMIAATIHF